MTPAQMDKDFWDQFHRNINNFDIIRVPDKTIKMIKDDFFPRWSKRKRSESDFRFDNNNMLKRCMTGFLGEAAMEIALGTEFIDWSVGNSSTYNYADLKTLGINVGIKTCDAPNFPVVKSRTYRPQVINIKVSHNEIMVGGYANLRTLRRYMDSRYIKNAALRNKGYKIAFTGIDHLQYFYSLDELKKLK